MTFQPQIGEPLAIDGLTYHVAAHPNAPGMPYGQEGRQATVYELIAGIERQALKVFKPRYRVPALVDLSDRQAAFASLPGLTVCRRTLLTARRHTALLRQYPELNYAVLMPWIGGPTWMEVLLDGHGWPREQGRAHSRALAEVLARMEERGLAHCDLSGPNVLLPALAEGVPHPAVNHSAQWPIELVDVEQMYGPGLERPDTLPAGSPGYAHRTAAVGMWEPAADRFAGAILIAEMLGWADDRVRATSWGESYFDPGELQQDGDRLRALLEALRTEAGEAAANLFLRAWSSATLADCPTFGDWLLVLPDSSTTERVQLRTNTQTHADSTGSSVQPSFTTQADVLSPPDAPDLPILFDAGLAALRAGDLDRADELLAAVARLQPNYTRGGQAVSSLLAVATKRKRANQTAKRQIKLFTLPALLVLLVTAVAVWQFVISTPQTQGNQGAGDTSTFTPGGALPQGTALSVLNIDRVELLTRIGKGPAGSLAWSADGHILAVGSSYGTYFYDPATLTDVRFIPQDAAVNALAFNPTDTLIASAGEDGKVRLWQSDTGELVKTLEGHLGPVRSVSFSPDGSKVVSGGMDTSVRTWRVSSGEQMLNLNGKHTVVSAAFSPDGSRLAAVSDHGEIQLWQANDGKLLRELEGSPGTNVTFSPDGTLLAAGSGEFEKPSVSIWRVSDGQAVHTLQAASEGAWAESVAFSPDGTVLAAGTFDSSVHFWKVGDGTPYGTPLRRTDPVMHIAYGPDGAMLATSGNGDSVWLTSGAGYGQDRELTGHTERTRAFAYSPKDTLFASGNGDGSISLWQGSDGSPLRTLGGHTLWINDLAFSPDGTLLASVSADNSTRLWRVADGKLVWALSTGNSASRTIAFSSDGQTIVGSDEGGTVHLWQTNSGAPIRQLAGYEATFSPDGKLFAVRTEDTLVQIWSVADWVLQRTLQASKRINRITFSPDGTLMAGGGDNLVQLWRVSDGQQVASAQEDVTDVLGTAFSPDGTLLATGGGDGALRLWRTTDMSLIRKLTGHTRNIWQVAFRPDGAQLASISEDGSIILWGLR